MPQSRFISKLPYLTILSLFAATLTAKTPAPEGGIALLPENVVATGSFWQGDNNGQAVATSQVVSVTHPDFNQALRVSVINPAGQFWNGAFQVSVNQDVAQGDVLLIRIFFRSIESNDESGAGFATVFPQGPAPDYTKYIQREITSNGDWVEYLFPFEMPEARSSGSLSFQVGAGAGAKTQIWEIGGIEFLNYKQTLEVEDLPITRPTYAGREPDAAWRTTAAARIEQHRKGDFQINVVDTQGNPVPNANVSIEFLRHAYHFGSVIVASRIMGNGSDDVTFREKFLELFNQSGPENDFKWSPWAGEWGSNFNSTQTLAAMQWLRDRKIYTRGHVMVWPSKRNLPNLMQSYLPEGNPAGADPAAKQVILDHIDDIASRSAAYIDEWDVINEPYDNFYLMDAFGDQVMLDWFAQARPHLKRHSLYINDYSILSGGGRDFAHQDHYEKTIQYLVSNDAQVDGIGMQGHFSSSPTAIETVYNILERFHAKFPSLDIRITEFDVSTDDEEMQADYTRDLLTILFSHPATVGLQAWGFWENAHWRPSAAMYTADWREKPNAVAWKKLTQETWWNDFSGATDSNGIFAKRGFYGDYKATVTVGEESYQFDFNLMKDGANIITLATGNPTVEAAAPQLTIGSNQDSVQLRLSDYNGKDLVIQKMGTLGKWKTVLDLKELTPGVVYEKTIGTDSTELFRVLEK